MANFTVTKDYQTLATIMGASYDNTKDYIIHVNEILLGLLQANASNTGRGKEYKSFMQFEVSKGTTIYLKGTSGNIDIYVEEKKTV